MAGKIKVCINDRRDFFSRTAALLPDSDLAVFCHRSAEQLDDAIKTRRTNGCDAVDCPTEEDSPTIRAIHASIRLILKGQQVFTPEYMVLSGYMAWCDRESTTK